MNEAENSFRFIYWSNDGQITTSLRFLNLIEQIGLCSSIDTTSDFWLNNSRIAAFDNNFSQTIICSFSFNMLWIISFAFIR